jgi:hypothetical protein
LPWRSEIAATDVSGHITTQGFLKTKTSGYPPGLLYTQLDDQQEGNE